jgi:hypothetical protein
MVMRCVVLGGDVVVVVLRGADLCGLCTAAAGVSIVGGWSGGSVGGDGVVSGGDGRVVRRGCCVVLICVVRFWRLQVWR